MEFKYYIDKEQKIVVRSFHGEVSLESLEKSLAVVWVDPDYSPLYSGVADFRDSKLLFSKVMLYKIIKTVSDNSMSLQGRVAILVSEPLSAAMATIYGEQLRNMSQVEIFCYTSVAAKFLEVDTNILDCLSDVKPIYVE
ncbi:hypothetical protein G3O08_09400 [Cryomorpha ignava]|uniref:Uncharacterized protein n=1 Tax=Cryomorpha ignava TaxID=101383 RepID=A0A7K3WQE3_9FLAO|nr:hypothetical protein [Cryomorpha ignava]NEN23714.1 hypothetical protein [Cryomorpha ignava]